VRRGEAFPFAHIGGASTQRVVGTMGLLRNRPEMPRRYRGRRQRCLALLFIATTGCLALGGCDEHNAGAPSPRRTPSAAPTNTAPPTSTAPTLASHTPADTVTPVSTSTPTNGPLPTSTAT